MVGVGEVMKDCAARPVNMYVGWTPPMFPMSPMLCRNRYFCVW